MNRGEFAHTGIVAAGGAFVPRKGLAQATTAHSGKDDAASTRETGQ